MTNTVPATSSPQFLDKLKVERERGITVKAQTVSIIHTHTDGNRYLINLIDTPGHVDFSYEVSRSLGACEGGLLLVDCTREHGLFPPAPCSCRERRLLSGIGANDTLRFQRVFRHKRYPSFTSRWKPTSPCSQ